MWIRQASRARDGAPKGAPESALVPRSRATRLTRAQGEPDGPNGVWVLVGDLRAGIKHRAAPACKSGESKHLITWVTAPCPSP